MVVPGFLRVLDSGMLLLLATTNTLLVQRAEAASSALAVDDGVCQGEVEACYDSGETCRTCLGVDDTVKTELAVLCAEGLDSEDSDSSEVTCDSVRSLFCCLDVMTPESACLDDDEFVEYARCFLESWGCPIGETVCETSSTQETVTAAAEPLLT